MDITNTPIMFSIQTRDVGSTIAVTLQINGKDCISWMAYTKYADRAIEGAIEELRLAVRDLLISRISGVEEAEYRLSDQYLDDIADGLW